MKVFMKDLWTGKWVLVHENDWDKKDRYIDDPLHHSFCWGDCYKEADLLTMERLEKSDKNEN